MKANWISIVDRDTILRFLIGSHSAQVPWVKLDRWALEQSGIAPEIRPVEGMPKRVIMCVCIGRFPIYVVFHGFNNYVYMADVFIHVSLGDDLKVTETIHLFECENTTAHWKSLRLIGEDYSPNVIKNRLDYGERRYYESCAKEFRYDAFTEDFAELLLSGYSRKDAVISYYRDVGVIRGAACRKPGTTDEASECAHNLGALLDLFFTTKSELHDKQPEFWEKVYAKFVEEHPEYKWILDKDSKGSEYSWIRDITLF